MDDDKKRPFLHRLLTFLITAALSLTALFLVANWQKLNFDFIRRYFTYRSLERNESGQVESFRYTGGSGSSFALLGSDLLVCSSSGVRLYSESGAAYVDQACNLTTPLLSIGSGAALAYDAGGQDLFVYKDRELVFSLRVEDGQSILSAHLSDQDRLTVVTQSSGVKGSVTVYNSKYEPELGVNLSSRFITDARLSPDGRTLAVATSGQTGGIYDSQIFFYSLSRGHENSEPDHMCSLGNNATLSMEWQGNTLRVLGENALSLLSPSGELKGSYPYNGRYLKGFSLEGNGFCSLLLGKYRAASTADLVTVDNNGQEISSLPLEEQVLSLSSNGRYLSVLTADALTIYTEALDIYHRLEEPLGVRRALQREDGSVTLISGETARLYLPD